MAYIGRGIENLINAQKLDAITPSTATGVGPYNLTQNSVAFVPASADALVVSINGVVQYGNFTISGSTITFSGALTDADTCDFIYQMGTGLLNTPADGTVNTAQLADGGVTNVKLGTDISASKITTGTLADARIPNLDTSKITTGTLDAARIDNASLANVTALPFSVGTDWQSTIVNGTTLTAEAGKGYWINTTSNACTVTLPASASVGDSIQIVDYAGTFATNNITLTSSLNIEGGGNKILTTNREGVTITYADATQGWVASSGVNEGTKALEPAPYSVDFLVIAGGGGGGNDVAAYAGGGGGAGGYRNSYSTETSGGGASSEASLTFNLGTVYTVTVGAGGAVTTNGADSSISGTGLSTITSTGGGCGKANSSGATGGSGGGAGESGTGGAGTANQGFAGANGYSGSVFQGGGGGGASAVGQASNGSSTKPNGGAGLASLITGSSVSRGGGGGGGSTISAPTLFGDGGTGGGGRGAVSGSDSAVAGTVNTGGGGGGGFGRVGDPAKAGGKGVVILRMPDAAYSGTTTGSPTVNTNVGGSGETVIIFNDSGSITG